MEAAISLGHVVKTFGERRAVDGLTFDVPRGAIFGLLGRNGAGKTTTLRMIMDIIRPDSGRIAVLGAPVDERVKDRIGYLPEERGMYPRMKVLDLLEFQGSIKNLRPGEARRRASAWLDRLELEEWKLKKVEELSKGMQQKVQFVAAVLHEPEVLLLDEPFSGMDPINQDLFKDLILEINRRGATIVFSTHVLGSAERLCRQIALIERGSAILHGPLETIKQRFGSNAVQLEFDGDGSFLRHLPAVERCDDYGRFLELRMRQGADPQEILRATVGRLRVRRFEVVSPTLHNIFIDQVGGKVPRA